MVGDTLSDEPKILAKYEYKPVDIDRGYANRTLYINLSTNEIKEKEVTQEMKDKFVGGKGFDLWLMWSAIKEKIPWDSPDNEICIASGPMGGTPIYPGSGKSIVTTICPLTGTIIDSNVGGYFGPYLKFSGFDALEIQGKAEDGVVLYINGIDHVVTIEQGQELDDKAYEITSELTKKFGGDDPRSVSVVTSGTAAKNTLLGCLNFSWYDLKRKRERLKQAGRGGIGTVFRDKGLTAIAVRSPRVSTDTNHPADKEALKEVARAHSSEIRDLDHKQNEMAVIGTTHIVTIMNDYDLLPTKNFKFGSHEKAPDVGLEVYRKKFDPGFDGCWMGCVVACSHGVKDFELKTGPKAGQSVFVDGPEYETIAGVGSNCGIFDPDHIIEMNYYCDTYGLDTISIGTGTAFVMDCYERGFITKEHTGGFELNFGNKDAALELLHQMARGEGFGMVVGQGIRKMKDHFEKEFGADRAIMEDIGMESKGLEFSEYMTKESLTQQGGYGLTLKGPQHDEAWLIFLDMVHNFMPSFEQKAEALHWFPMFRTWFGLCGLCKLPWNDIVPEDNREMPEPAKVMKHVTWYSQYFQSVTGVPCDPDKIIEMSEKVYNFQRIFNIKMGLGKREHDTLPYRAIGPVTEEEYESRQERYDTQMKEMMDMDPEGMSTAEKVTATRKYREEQYEKLKDAVYKRRGWTNDGVPTIEKVKEMGIDFEDVIETIKPYQ